MRMKLRRGIGVKERCISGQIVHLPHWCRIKEPPTTLEDGVSPAYYCLHRFQAHAFAKSIQKILLPIAVSVDPISKALACAAVNCSSDCFERLDVAHLGARDDHDRDAHPLEAVVSFRIMQDGGSVLMV